MRKTADLRSLPRFVIHALVTVACVGPLFWILSISLRSRQEFGNDPFGLPTRLYMDNYLKIVQDEQMLHFFLNSVITTAVSMALLLSTSTLAAYAIARLKFRGRTFLFILFLMGDMIPIIVIIIPLFMLNRLLGLNMSRWGLILPYVAGNMGFSVFVLRGFWRSVSSDMEDAARIDGCNTLQLICWVMIPLVRPGMIVVAIMTFIFFWNEYYLASILLPGQDLFTLPAGLASTFFGRFRQDWPAAASGALLSIVPVVLIYLFAQDRIIQGWKSL